MLPRFEYVKPQTVKEALSILALRGKESKLLAGGTDLLVLMRAGIVKPKCIVDIKAIKELGVISFDKKEGMVLGATVTLNELLDSKLIKAHYRILHKAAALHSDYEIRNRATVGGNICNALPSADMVPPLVVLDAKARIMGPKTNRIVEIEEMFKGTRKTVLKNNEILTEIHVPPAKARTGTAFLKIGRTAEDLAMVNVAVRVTLQTDGTCSDAKIAIGGGVGPTLVVARKGCSLLINKKIVDDLIEKAAAAASKEITPRTSSFRGSPAYKANTSKILVRRALRTALDEAKGRC